jgi:hypothetical protein
VSILQTWRKFISYRRLLVTFAVAGSMGLVEWMGLGHPIGLLFGLAMGLMALLISPLPWLWILPWGLRRPWYEIGLRAAGVMAISTAVVVLAFIVFFEAQTFLIPVRHPLVRGAIPHLSAWSSMLVSIPLFAAAGWGLSRHLELERRLEVRTERELVLRDALDKARLMALQSRLDPHFLFNTLNLVAELCRDEPEEAERCVVRLSGLLRAALEHAEQPLIPLGRELDLCLDYLGLCGTRFGDRLQVEVDRDPVADSAQVPLFAVQVLCENAVRHGVERQAAGGLVRIESSRADTTIQVRVTSPGPFRGPRKGGQGIDLIRRRLALAYREGDAGLSVQTAPDGDHTVAELALPLSQPTPKRDNDHDQG